MAHRPSADPGSGDTQEASPCFPPEGKTPHRHPGTDLLHLLLLPFLHPMARRKTAGASSALTSTREKVALRMEITNFLKE